MDELRWSKLAKNDLLNIVDYISEDNPLAALNLAADIDQKVKKLIDFPEFGRIGRVTGTRELVVFSSYIVVYQLRVNSIRILRVLHASQQWP